MTTRDSSRRMIARIERERDALIGKATAPTRHAMVNLRKNVIRAYRTGNDIGQAIREGLAVLHPQLQDAMAAGHLQGRYRVALNATAAKRRIDGASLSVYDDALRFLSRRLVLTAAETAALRAAYGADALASLGSASRHVNELVDRAVFEAVRQGLTTDAGTELIRRALDSAGVTLDNPFLAETIFRTQLNLAYSAGRQNAYEDPDIDEILVGFEYNTVGDDRVRPNHAAMDGLVLPKDHPLWNSIMPPNGWNCRCTVLEVFEGDDISFKQPMGEPVQADDGWGFNPGQLFRDNLAA